MTVADNLIRYEHSTFRTSLFGHMIRVCPRIIQLFYFDSFPDSGMYSRDQVQKKRFTAKPGCHLFPMTTADECKMCPFAGMILLLDYDAKVKALRPVDLQLAFDEFIKIHEL
jgi:hypothetical protein